MFHLKIHPSVSSTATLCLFFLIVFHLKFPNVYTETTVVSVETAAAVAQWNLEKKKKKTEEEERKKLSVFVRVLFKNKRKHSHMRLQVTQSFPTQMSRGLLTESETLETSAHRDNPQHSVMRWSILNGQTCECNHLAIWNSFHLNSGYRQLWAFIHQRLLSSTTFCREMFLNSRVASDVLRLDLLFLRERCFKLGLRAATVVKGSVQL